MSVGKEASEVGEVNRIGEIKWVREVLEREIEGRSISLGAFFLIVVYMQVNVTFTLHSQ